MYLIDTHTHFDIPDYDNERNVFNQRAYQQGVRHVLLIGFLAKYFAQMATVKQQADEYNHHPKHHLAFGLHPLYIKEQHWQDLQTLEGYIQTHQSVAIGEIGLDTFDVSLRQADVYQKQQAFFIEQIEMAKRYDLPIVLHIRKAHADVLKLLKQQGYRADNYGGIAHSFSGGENEALAFVKMGFKIGITGQITNPNAKKLHKSVKTVFDKYGTSAFVIETDCPDMMPLPCQHDGGRLNEPANLIHVLNALSKLLQVDKVILAKQLWQNSLEALRVDWGYPDFRIDNDK